jgi:hypothetical protein
VTSPHKSVGLACAAALLLAVTLALEAQWFAARHSLTYDETIYLNLAIRSVDEGRLDPAYMTLGVAPLPSYITFIGPMLGANEPPRPSVDTGRSQDPRLIRTPRLLNTLLVAVPLMLTVFWWLWRRRGLGAALLGGGLLALSPTIVAHGAVATTDASLALFTTLGLAAIAWLAARPSAARAVVCAFAIAAAMSAKYSGVFLIPVAAAVLFLAAVGRTHDVRPPALLRALGTSIGYSLAIVAVVLPLWWGAHGFVRANSEQLATAEQVDPRELPAEGSVRRLLMTPAPIVGFVHQLRHARGGDEAFLMGERSNDGWWYYFPLVLFFKSTPAELALFALVVAGIAASVRHPWRNLIALDPTRQCLLIAAVVFGALLVTSNLNLGHRYAIPLYPMLALGGCDLLSRYLGGRRRAFLSLASALLAAQAFSSVTIAPHYLAYINALSGGPANGWRLLADSSLDWGQDLPALKQYLDAQSPQPVAIKYFGTALPEAYGIEADEFEHLRRAPDEYGALAVSATYLNGLYLGGGRDPFQAFRALRPAALVGYSILVYDLRSPEAQFAFQEALKVLH